MTGELALRGSPASCRGSAGELRQLAGDERAISRIVRDHGLEQGSGLTVEALRLRLTTADDFAARLARDSGALADALDELAVDLEEVHTLLERARGQLEPLGLVTGDSVIDPATRPELLAEHPGLPEVWAIANAVIGSARAREESAQQQWLHALAEHTDPDNLLATVIDATLPSTTGPDAPHLPQPDRPPGSPSTHETAHPTTATTATATTAVTTVPGSQPGVLTGPTVPGTSHHDAPPGQLVPVVGDTQTDPVLDPVAPEEGLTCGPR